MLFSKRMYVKYLSDFCQSFLLKPQNIHISLKALQFSFEAGNVHLRITSHSTCWTRTYVRTGIYSHKNSCKKHLQSNVRTTWGYDISKLFFEKLEFRRLGGMKGCAQVWSSCNQLKVNLLHCPWKDQFMRVMHFIWKQEDVEYVQLVDFLNLSDKYFLPLS